MGKFMGKSHPSQPSESHQQPEINRISTKIKHLETTSSLLHRPPYLTSQCLPHTLNHNHTSPHLLLKNTTSSHHSRSQHTHARCTNTPKSRWHKRARQTRSVRKRVEYGQQPVIVNEQRSEDGYNPSYQFVDYIPRACR